MRVVLPTCLVLVAAALAWQSGCGSFESSDDSDAGANNDAGSSSGSEASAPIDGSTTPDGAQIIEVDAGILCTDAGGDYNNARGCSIDMDCRPLLIACGCEQGNQLIGIATTFHAEAVLCEDSRVCPQCGSPNPNRFAEDGKQQPIPSAPNREIAARCVSSRCVSYVPDGE